MLLDKSVGPRVVKRATVSVPRDRCIVESAAGALGCSISGSGPSVFAWTLSADAEAARDAMVAAFAAAGVEAQAWISAIEPRGARLLDERCAS